MRRTKEKRKQSSEPLRLQKARLLQVAHQNHHPKLRRKLVPLNLLPTVTYHREIRMKKGKMKMKRKVVKTKRRSRKEETKKGKVREFIFVCSNTLHAIQ
uniref:Ovule protein n=1 Tax=Ascaris lumbricoides TaxID=6252 RepID=A0A0M3HFZ1_ASCLU